MDMEIDTGYKARQRKQKKKCKTNTKQTVLEPELEAEAESGSEMKSKPCRIRPEIGIGIGNEDGIVNRTNANGNTTGPEEAFRRRTIRGPTPQRVAWTVTGPSLAGRLHSLGFCWWVSSRESHTTLRQGHLRVTISTVPDPSRSSRVDMHTSPVAAVRAVVATGAWVLSKHDICLIRGGAGA